MKRRKSHVIPSREEIYFNFIMIQFIRVHILHSRFSLSNLVFFFLSLAQLHESFQNEDSKVEKFAGSNICQFIYLDLLRILIPLWHLLWLIGSLCRQKVDSAHLLIEGLLSLGLHPENIISACVLDIWNGMSSNWSLLMRCCCCCGITWDCAWCCM